MSHELEHAGHGGANYEMGQQDDKTTVLTTHPAKVKKLLRRLRQGRHTDDVRTTERGTARKRHVETTAEDAGLCREKLSRRASSS